MSYHDCIGCLARQTIIDKYKEALEEISEGKGAYNMDPLTHASNTIRDMVELAKKVLEDHNA